MSSFTDFKIDFYSRIKDYTLFNCDEVNLLKVVLDGLRVNYNKGNKIGSDFLLHPILFNAKNSVRRLRSQNKIKIINASKQLEIKNRKYLIGFSERFNVISSGERKSLYFESIFQELQHDNFVFIGEDTSQLLDVDFKSNYLVNLFSSLSITQQEKRFQKDLKRTFLKLQHLNLFTEKEIQGIQCAFEIFFKHYIAWNKILKILKPKAAIFDQHYHREGFILACNQNKIKTIELQHGLIAEQDIFYVFPKETKDVLNKSLFADEILVYGEYWKNKLLKGFEYPKEKIKVLGFYHFESNFECSDETLLEFIKSTSIILITTQTSLHESYIKYVKHLSNLIKLEKYDWKILVKTHPAESIEVYNQLNDLGNCKVVNFPLNYLFSITKIHISIYSTTLYDAHRFNVKSYTIPINPYTDYSKQISNDGIAEELLENENPISRYIDSVNSNKVGITNQLYQNLDISVLKKSLGEI